MLMWSEKKYVRLSFMKFRFVFKKGKMYLSLLCHSSPKQKAFFLHLKKTKNKNKTKPFDKSKERNIIKINYQQRSINIGCAFKLHVCWETKAEMINDAKCKVFNDHFRMIRSLVNSIFIWLFNENIRLFESAWPKQFHFHWKSFNSVQMRWEPSTAQPFYLFS